MKKIVLLLAIVAIFAFTSCKDKEEVKTDTTVEEVDTTTTVNDTVVITNDTVKTDVVSTSTKQ